MPSMIIEQSIIKVIYTTILRYYTLDVQYKVDDNFSYNEQPIYQIDRQETRHTAVRGLRFLTVITLLQNSSFDFRFFNFQIILSEINSRPQQMLRVSSLSIQYMDCTWHNLAEVIMYFTLITVLFLFSFGEGNITL